MSGSTLARLQRPRAIVALLAVSAIFVNILDLTVVNVALPSIGRSFHLSASANEAPVVGFVVATAVAMPTADQLARRVGLARAYAISLGLFVLASALCAIAWSIASLTMFRFAQGTAAGLLSPVAMTMLLTTFGASERVRVGRLLMFPTTVAPAVGPLVGGVLSDGVGWRWIFLVNVPVGVAALIVWRLRLDRASLAPPMGQPPSTFDLLGLVTGGGGLAALLFALAVAAQRPVGNVIVWLPALAGVVLLVTFVVVERRTRSPLLDLSTLSDRLFLTCGLAQTFALATFLGILFLVPLLLQDVDGLSATHTGLCTATEAVGVLTGTQLVAALYPVLGPKPLLLTGAAGIGGAGLALAATVSTSPWATALLMFAAGLAMSFIFLSAETAAFTQVRSVGSASVLFNVLMQVGSAVGVCAGALTLGVSPGMTSAAFRGGLIVVSCFGIAALFAAGAVHNADAAPTMSRPRQSRSRRSPVRESAVSE